MSSTDEGNLTLPQLFGMRVSLYQDRPGLFSYSPSTRQFQPISWNLWLKSVQHTALALTELGAGPGDRAAILSENRPEWTFADLGALSIGGVVVPIYPTSSSDDVAYILDNAEASFLFISTAVQLERLWPVLETRPALRAVICFEPPVFKHAKLLSFEAFLAKGEQAEKARPSRYAELLSQGHPDDLATIIYTSGTTGPPKGVMLTHRNFVENYLGAKTKIKISDQDTALSFLPLSHVFERLAGYYFMLFHGASIAYAQSMQTVSEDMKKIHPTICAAVPRFYEKVYAKILEKAESSLIRKKIFHWAVQSGKRRNAAVQSGKPLGFFEAFSYVLARRLVFDKLKKNLGGKLRFFISGGAPLSKELAEFFFTAGILILEGYGLTETSPVMTVNSPEAFRFGTVGKSLHNVEVKIAPDGEIVTRGPCVMKGYYNNPQATAEVMREGWFHTGDIGVFEDGFLKITDRKKDIIATSGGKKISPQNIEGKILADALFSQVVIIGDKKNYLVALTVPNRLQTEQAAREKGITADSYEALLRNERIVEWLEMRLRAKTEGLASYEQIKYVTFLAREFSQENGELTPTLKCKRRYIMEKYKTQIDAMYPVK